MRKIFIDSIINLAFLTTIIFTSSFFISKIQSSIHYHRADIPPLLILSIVIFGSLLSSFISGWLLLTKYYLTDIPSPPELSTWQTGNIGLFSYRNSLKIGIIEEGIYLSLIFMMRLFHPPLLIPWEKISKAGINSFDEYEIYVDIPIFPNSPTIIRLPKETL
ncbi:MAG: hypothetical protein AAF349_09450 [Cyanobacteria bacterium P01_A01_bin.68]